MISATSITKNAVVYPIFVRPIMNEFFRIVPTEFSKLACSGHTQENAMNHRMLSANLMTNSGVI